MASVSTYLNFNGETEAAFNLYKDVFGTEFLGVMRHSDVPVPEGQPGPSDELKNQIINIALPILGGHVLMGTDVPAEMGKVVYGTNSYICLMPDSRSEADRLFAALSDGGKIESEMQEMFWGDYYGSFTDRFGVQWMINCASKE